MATEQTQADLEQELEQLLDQETFEPSEEFRKAALWNDDSVYEQATRAAAARAGDTEALVAHSVAFHRTIVAAAGNDLLLKLWDSLHPEIHTRITLSEPGLDYMAAAESHQPIVDAIRAGDIELVCRLSRDHQAYFEHRCD